MKLSAYQKSKIYKEAKLVAEMREDIGSVLIPDDFISGVKWAIKYLEKITINEDKNYDNQSI